MPEKKISEAECIAQIKIGQRVGDFQHQIKYARILDDLRKEAKANA